MKEYNKMKRITMQPDELLIIDCLDNYEVVATAENFDRVFDSKQIKIDCREIKNLRDESHLSHFVKNELKNSAMLRMSKEGKLR